MHLLYCIHIIIILFIIYVFFFIDLLSRYFFAMSRMLCKQCWGTNIHVRKILCTAVVVINIAVVADITQAAVIEQCAGRTILPVDPFLCCLLKVGRPLLSSPEKHHKPNLYCLILKYIDKHLCVRVRACLFKDVN